MIVAWTIRIDDVSERPAERASTTRLIGVTRIRSTTPLRISAISPKPPNAVPKMAIWMISPGTNQLNAFVPVPAVCHGPFEERPEQDEIEDRHHHPEHDPDRLSEGQDERSAEDEPGVADESSCRGFLSWSVGIRRPRRRAASDRSGGGRRRRGWGDGGRSMTPRARRRRGRGGAAGRRLATVDVEPDDAVLAGRLAHERLAPDGFEDVLGRAVDDEGDDVAGDLALQLVGRALGDDLAVVDDRQPVGQGVGLLEVVRGQEDGRAAGARRWRISSHIRARACGSRPVVGSSRNRTDGRWTMPRPTSSRRFMPPE